jgi:LysM domain
MDRCLILLVGVMIGCTLQAQDRLDCHDTLTVIADQAGTQYMVWKTGLSTTLNTITSVTGLDGESVLSINPILRFRDIAPCDYILVPFDSAHIGHVHASRDIPLGYKVKQGETIFHIARRIFQIPVDSLMQLNNLHSSELHEGQWLRIGWYHTTPAPQHESTLEPAAGKWFYDAVPGLDSARVHYSEGKEYASQRGVAWWNKGKPDPNLFALHRDAPLNSYIEIRNPMFGRSVWAKVIGTIPPTYPEDIAVIISEGVARQLGAIDSRFYVELRYETEGMDH